MSEQCSKGCLCEFTQEEKSKMGLGELLFRARLHVMTPEEQEAQRQSWVRGEAALAQMEKNMTTMFEPVCCYGAIMSNEHSADCTGAWPKQFYADANQKGVL